MNGSYVGKTWVAILAAISIINYSHAQGDYTVTERGPDYKVLQKTVVEHGTNRVHKYTELATGMNYTNAYGQLVESSEQITLLPSGGAIANHGRHTVSFPSDIYNGVLEVVTPDGRHLRSRPLGVSYDDGSNTVFIATLKNAQGYLTSSNQVTYRDAFTGFKADLVCTYRRSGFECDLVFRQQPPTPGDYGLDESWSTLQLVTEFFNTQDPEQIPAGSDDWFGLQDSTLKFGKLTMTHGKAFAFKGTNSTARPFNTSAVPVYKTWLHSGGRTFLIEELPVLDLVDDLNALPLTASIKSPKSKVLFASNKRQFPPAHEIVACTNQILLASAGFTKEPGVVLDYNTIDSDQTDFTFESGQTYYISDHINIDGVATFEGGAVLKFPETLALDYLGWGLLTCNSNVVCNTTVDHPALLTSMNDDSVGETITGSSGTPAPGWITYLTLNYPADPLKHLRMLYGQFDVFYNVEDITLEISDCQFFYVDSGGAAIDGNTAPNSVILKNVLFSQCYAAVCNESGYAYNVSGTHVTADQMESFFLVFGDAPVAGLTNSLLTSIDDIDGVTLYASAWPGSGSGIYQSAANANYYLATNSPYRNVGTTNIAPDLLAAIQMMTTYAPQDGGYLDTDTPDLGYHYPVNEDSDYDGLPDWWEWKWFGNYTHAGSELDASGNTLLSDYLGNLNPLQPFSIFVATPGNSILQP